MPAPPSFDPNRLVRVEMPSFMALSYGVDPSTLSIGKDGVVRYVMVASNASGAFNAMYEGIRCATAEVKTYARSSSNGQWRMNESGDWRSLGTAPYAMALARQGACEGLATATSVATLLRSLRGVPNDQQRH